MKDRDADHIIFISCIKYSSDRGPLYRLDQFKRVKWKENAVAFSPLEPHLGI